MIVKMRAEDIKGTNLKVVTSEREVQGYIKVITPLSDLESIVSKYDGYSKVVAFELEYVDLDTCIAEVNAKLTSACATPVLLKYDIRALDDYEATVAEASAILDKITSPVVRLVVHFPDDYCNMLVPYSLSLKYGSRVTTCGGNFIRLPNCNIGCIQAQDIKGRMFKGISLVCKDCACVLPTLAFEDAEVIWGTGEIKKGTSSSTSKGTSREAKPKKALASLFTLGQSSYNNF